MGSATSKAPRPGGAIEPSPPVVQWDRALALQVYVGVALEGFFTTPCNAHRAILLGLGWVSLCPSVRLSLCCSSPSTQSSRRSSARWGKRSSPSWRIPGPMQVPFAPSCRCRCKRSSIVANSSRRCRPSIKRRSCRRCRFPSPRGRIVVLGSVAQRGSSARWWR